MEIDKKNLPDLFLFDVEIFFDVVVDDFDYCYYCYYLRNDSSNERCVNCRHYYDIYDEV